MKWYFADLPSGVKSMLRRWGEMLFGRGASPLLLLAAVLGSVAGLISAGFWDAIAALSAICSYYVVRPLNHLLPLPWTWASWGFLLPAAGGALVGLLAHRVFRTPHRLGVPAVMLDARREWGRIPLRYVPSTFFNSLLTIGTGGSAGREAPVVAMGGGLGAWMARRLSLPPVQRRILVGCGAAAAIAAAFNAPLAGVFFALEVVLGDWRSGTLAPVMLASVAGTVVCRAAEGGPDASHFQVPPYQLAVWWEVFVYVGLGLVAGLAGQVFMRALEGAEHKFEKMEVPAWVIPTIGGLGVGLVGLALPGVLGNGYPWAALACEGMLSWKLLLLLVVGKILATSLTLGSGGWGGDFAPTLFVGAMVGGVYGKLMGTALGGAIAGSGAYAMVGMGALLAAMVRCPTTAVLLLFELTGSYQVILPIMVAVATATFVSRRFSRYGLYHQRLRELGGPAFEMWTEGAFAHLTAGEVMRRDMRTVPEATSYHDLLHIVTESPQSVFPVVRYDGTMLGVVRLTDLRPHLVEAGAGDIPVVAAELAIEDVPFVTVETPVREVAGLLAEVEWEELPVVGDVEDRKPCGIISRQDVLRATLATLRERGR